MHIHHIVESSMVMSQVGIGDKVLHKIIQLLITGTTGYSTYLAANQGLEDVCLHPHILATKKRIRLPSRVIVLLYISKS